jgi:hypothetical protein
MSRDYSKTQYRITQHLCLSLKSESVSVTVSVLAPDQLSVIHLIHRRWRSPHHRLCFIEDVLQVRQLQCSQVHKHHIDGLEQVWSLPDLNPQFLGLFLCPAEKVIPRELSDFNTSVRDGGAAAVEVLFVLVDLSPYLVDKVSVDGVACDLVSMLAFHQIRGKPRRIANVAKLTCLCWA